MVSEVHVMYTYYHIVVHDALRCEIFVWSDAMQPVWFRPMLATIVVNLARKTKITLILLTG